MSSFDVQDVLGPSRDVVDAEKAQKLAEALETAGAITRIRLTGKSFTQEGAAIVAAVLEKITTLVEVDISDIIASRPESEGLEVLRTFSGALVASKGTIVELNLSDNALGEKGLRACEALLSEFESLRRLYLCNNGLSAEACEVIADLLLFRGEDQDVPLTVFHFHDNMCGDQGGIHLAKLVEKMTSVESLRFSKTRCGREGCEALAAAVAKCENLREAFFEDISFGAEGTSILARSLEQCTKLRYLDLRDALLEEEGAEDLLEMLASDVPELAFLDLSGNDLTAGTVERVVSTLNEKPHLAYLALDDNEIGNLGAFLLGKACTTPGFFPALTTVSCKSCDITSTGAHFLVHAGAIRKLKSILLDGNAINEITLEKCESILEDAGGMEVLGSLEDNDPEGEEDPDDEGIEEITSFDWSSLYAYSNSDSV